MEPIADKKIHVALSPPARPTLAEQAAQMAEDFARNEDRRPVEPSILQEPSMMSEETWVSAAPRRKHDSLPRGRTRRR